MKANQLLEREIQAFKKEVAELMANVSSTKKVDEEVEEEERIGQMAEEGDEEKSLSDGVSSTPKKYHHCSQRGSGKTFKEIERVEEKNGGRSADTKSNYSFQSRDSGMGDSVISKDSERVSNTNKSCLRQSNEDLLTKACLYDS